MSEYNSGDIIKAAQNGDVKLMKQCMNLGADVNEEDRNNGFTPLIYVADPECTPAKAVAKAAIEFLISHKANVNHKSTYGLCALYYAACRGDKSICEVLLKAGAVKYYCYNGKTPAQWAVIQGHKDLAAFIESWGTVKAEAERLTIEVAELAEHQAKEKKMVTAITFSDLEFVKQLGEGGFGTVWLGQWISRCRETVVLGCYVWCSR